MNPFRATTSDKDRLTALAERLILSMASAQVDLPAVRPESLWALAIAVGGWWLKGNAPGIEEELRPFLALPLLYGQLNGIQSMPNFAAAASNATNASQLARGGQRFADRGMHAAVSLVCRKASAAAARGQGEEGQGLN